MHTKLKKIVVTVALMAAFILSSGLATSSFAVTSSAHPGPQFRDRGRHRGWSDRRRHHDRDHFDRIRRLDRNGQLRYRFSGSNRLVGYYDRFGRFHAYGYYDRFGRFHRY